MVDGLSNIRYQNSIYYNKYIIANQVFKATFFTESRPVCIRSRRLASKLEGERLNFSPKPKLTFTFTNSFTLNLLHSLIHTQRALLYLNLYFNPFRLVHKKNLLTNSKTDKKLRVCVTIIIHFGLSEEKETILFSNFSPFWSARSYSFDRI